VVDTQFNTTDVCIVLQTARLTERYLRHYRAQFGSLEAA
jgi:putative hemolysin